MGRMHPGMRCRALFLLTLISTASICRSASLTNTGISAPSDSTAGPQGRKPDQEVGSPSELAWQAWLLVDAQTGAHSGQDSASLLRRITPKSVFIAPALSLPACADGYRADAMGRCVKNINIDNQAHFDFLLERLNTMYANSDNGDKDDDLPLSASATGPLQVNIPLDISGAHKSENADAEDTMEYSMAVPLQGEPEDPKEKKEAVVTVYEVKNGTKDEESKSTFFRGNSTKGSVSSSLSDVVVPVAEFVEDSNQTFPEVVDYEVPVPLKSLFNDSHVGETSGNVTPVVMLLLSPTKLPLTVSTPVADELDFERNSTSGQIVVRTQNTADKSAEKEIISVSVPSSVAQAIRIPSAPAASEESSGESARPQGGELLHNAESTKLNNTDVVSLKDDEEYDESAATPEEVASPPGNKVPANSGPTDEKNDDDEATSNVSSEVSIRGDVIFETTLVDLNTDNVTSDIDDTDELTELLEAEEELQSEPEVVFSSQNSRGTAPSIHSMKRAEEIRRPDTRIRDEPTRYSLPSYSDTLLYDSHPHQGEQAPDVRTIDEQASFNQESIILPDSQPQNYFRPQNVDSSSSFRPQQDFVRFPENRPMTPSIRNYVRFPSDEANSIQAQDYKERQGYPDDVLRSSTSTKSSVPIHQKQTHWWLPPGWRVNPQSQDVLLQQPQQQQSSPKQRPMLLRFWGRMPLVKDPSLYEPVLPPQRASTGPLPGAYLSQHQFQPHRMNFYKEMSVQDVNRVFSQKLRTPIGG